MPYYGIGGSQTTTASANKGSVATWTLTATLKRHKWYEVIIGATGNPNATDTYIQIDISRLLATTSLAGSAAVPAATDPADGVSIITSLINITTEPNAAIVTPSLMNFGLNQRNTTRWIAAQESQYLVAPATNINGLYMRENSNAYTGSVATQLYFME
jgi:hypothetical protein